MRYRIYRNSRGYCIKTIESLFWGLISYEWDYVRHGFKDIKYFTSLNDAIKEIEKLEIDKKPKLIKEL